MGALSRATTEGIVEKGKELVSGWVGGTHGRCIGDGGRNARHVVGCTGHGTDRSGRISLRNSGVSWVQEEVKLLGTLPLEDILGSRRHDMLGDAVSAKRKMSKPACHQTIAKYGYSNLRKSLWQLFNTFIPYCVVWALMVSTVQRGYPYWITLALAVVAAGFMVRIFILFHDCCHGSFFASRRANTVLGYVSGIVTFTPFENWRFSHNLHHVTAGDLDRRGAGAIRTMIRSYPVQSLLVGVGVGYWLARRTR